MKELKKSGNKEIKGNTVQQSLLTIGIPAYNSESTIGKVLDSIISQITPEMDGNLNIVVSNNASTDKTKDIVDEYVKSNSFITLVNQKENIFYDRNVDSVIRNSNSKYVWCLSSNDYVLPGILSIVFSELKKLKNDIALGFCNFYNSITIDNKNNEVSSVLPPGDDFFTITKFKGGLISSLLVNKDIWISSHMEIYFDSLWIQFGYQLEAAHKYSSIIIHPYCVDGVENKSLWGGKGTYLYTHLKLLNLFKSFKKNKFYSKKTEKLADEVIIGSYPNALIAAKAAGLKVKPDLLSGFLTCLYMYVRFWFIYLPILLIPQFIYRGLYLMYKRIKALKELTR